MPSSSQIIIAEHLAASPSIAAIQTSLEQAISQHHFPGAVILASHQGKIIYQGVFGHRRLMPDMAMMEFTTLFDVASLSKVIVTTIAIMQLQEQNLINLDALVADYWPAFACDGKDKISLRHLLTHTSGLPSAIYSPSLAAVLKAANKPPLASPRPIWQGYEQAISIIEASNCEFIPGSQFSYGDINFIILGHLIQLVSGQSLEDYAEQAIFRPLAMHKTGYLPLRHQNRENIAPTELLQGSLRWGEVHDPTTYLMGGVSGAAGLFSCASDIALFADCILNQGLGASQRLLTTASVQQMTSPQTPAHIPEVRGLGWDINSPFSCHGRLWPATSFDHTGWTGTSLLFSPEDQLWLLILTNRNHPQIHPSANFPQQRRDIADLLLRALAE